jgi:hypothetical protein
VKCLGLLDRLIALALGYAKLIRVRLAPSYPLMLACAIIIVPSGEMFL